MPIELPVAGKTYVSQTDSSMVVYIVDVVVSKPGDDTDSPFIVEGCDPAYKDDIENADGFELTAEVWKKHNFKLVV